MHIYEDMQVKTVDQRQLRHASICLSLAKQWKYVKETLDFAQLRQERKSSWVTQNVEKRELDKKWTEMKENVVVQKSKRMVKSILDDNKKRNTIANLP